MNFRKALFVQIFPEASHNSLLNAEAGAFPDVSEGNGPQIQTGFQRNVHLRLGYGNGKRRSSPGKHGNAFQTNFNSIRRFFRRGKDSAGLHRIRFLQLLQRKLRAGFLIDTLKQSFCLTQNDKRHGSHIADRMNRSRNAHLFSEKLRIEKL